MAEYIEREAVMKRIKAHIKQITPIEESRDMFFHDSGINGEATGAWLEVKNAPAADVVEVVRCRDCKHFNMRELECQNDAVSTDHEGGASYSLNFYLDDFCSYGERRNDDR